jgi:hypothetical protein
VSRQHSRHFDSDPTMGKTETFHWLGDGKFAIETQQDVTDLVEQNRAIFNENTNGFRGEMHRVASIPLVLYWDLKKQGIIDDPERLKRWLNDPDNVYFRTKPGRV